MEYTASIKEIDEDKLLQEYELVYRKTYREVKELARKGITYHLIVILVLCGISFLFCLTISTKFLFIIPLTLVAFVIFKIIEKLDEEYTGIARYFRNRDLLLNRSIKIILRFRKKSLERLEKLLPVKMNVKFGESTLSYSISGEKLKKIQYFEKSYSNIYFATFINESVYIYTDMMFKFKRLIRIQIDNPQRILELKNLLISKRIKVI